MKVEIKKNLLKGTVISSDKNVIIGISITKISIAVCKYGIQSKKNIPFNWLI